PEEAELAEEMEAAMMSYGEEQPKPGQPSFVFVSKISDADHQKALAEAFEKARAEAGRLAKAASVELGSLSQLTSGGEQGFNMEDYSSFAQRYAFFGSSGMPGSPSTGAGVREASGPQPGPVKYTVAVKASFNLKSP
ncbi:MAG: SIMPL domain-containing protein, partial [Pirellulales bacterium]